MQIDKAKTAAVIVVGLLLASVMMIALPVQSAEGQLAAEQPYQTATIPAGVTPDAIMTTVASLSFRPNPIGVNQLLLVNFWTTPALASNQRYMPQADKITITKPDGTQDVRIMDSEPATGANYFEMIPDQVGEWTFKFEFLGVYFPAGGYYNGKIVTNSSGLQYGSAFYKPSATEEQTLTVQQDFVYSWPPAPLPTDYWQRPASLNNREWWPILGNYPATGYVGGCPPWDELYPNTNYYDSPGRYNFVPWVQAPNTPHVLWKRQDAIAGIIGGGLATQYGLLGNPNTPNLVYNGRMYDSRSIYIESLQAFTTCSVCTDLYTGEYYYKLPGGITPQYIAYLEPQATSETIAGEELGSRSWSVELIAISGSRLYKINPTTGALSGNYSISPLTSTSSIFCNQLNGYVCSVQNIGNTTNPDYRLINWTTRGTSSTLTSRIVSNITWPFINMPNQYTGGTGVGQGPTVGIALTDFNAGVVAMVNRVTHPGSEILWNITVTGYSLTTGQPLGWKVSLPDEGTYSSSAMVADHGKVAFLTQRGVFQCYDLFTGQLAWISEQMEYPWGSASFGAYAVQSAYGMLFRQSYDGVYAFNWTNGKIVWKYVAPAYAHFESPYIEDGVEEYSFNSGGIIADGKMYVSNTEHTPTWPMTRGWGIHCINITTGEKIWTLNNPMSVSTVSNGYITAGNSWDGYMYVIGKGKSATTVTAEPGVIADGDMVLIKGSVLDMSAAQPGTPCVSASSMETQMEYLHLQMPIDGIWHNLTITGVPVTLTAIASDGTVLDLGTTTTSGYYGTFEMAWTPSAEGTYKIIASFASDDSYGSSAASTAVTVGPAPEVPNNGGGGIEAQPDNTMLLYGILVAVVIAIIIGLVAVLLALRRR
jgi:hypothetical protein